MSKTAVTAGAAIAAILGSPALGGYTITQGTTASTYTGMTLNFDEPGGPEGVVAQDAWLESHGLYIDAGDGQPVVGDFDTDGWGLGEGKSFFGNFGVFMTFDSDLTAMSIEVWDPSGDPGPFGGGLGVYLFNDGNEVASVFVAPAWGGIGEPWFDITTDGGDVFDEVRILGYGFFPTTYVDNLSWDLAGGSGCPADTDGDGVVGIVDMLNVLANWGTNGAGAGIAEPFDTVDILDFLGLLAEWGPCP